MIPSQVFSHIVFVKKLCIVILHLLGHAGSITFLWTPFFYLLKPFTPLLGNTEGVNSANLCLGMGKVTSLLCVDKRWLKHEGNSQLCVIKLLLSADKATPYFWAMNMVSKTRPICEYIPRCFSISIALSCSKLRKAAFYNIIIHQYLQNETGLSQHYLIGSKVSTGWAKRNKGDMNWSK